jgi:hypothetical protein
LQAQRREFARPTCEEMLRPHRQARLQAAGQRPACPRRVEHATIRAKGCIGWVFAASEWGCRNGGSSNSSSRAVGRRSPEEEPHPAGHLSTNHGGYPDQECGKSWRSWREDTGSSKHEHCGVRVCVCGRKTGAVRTVPARECDIGVMLLWALDRAHLRTPTPIEAA